MFACVHVHVHTCVLVCVPTWDRKEGYAHGYLKTITNVPPRHPHGHTGSRSSRLQAACRQPGRAWHGFWPQWMPTHGWWDSGKCSSWFLPVGLQVGRMFGV